jgi:RNA polymerase sigma-70 factor (ECF subfamily)
MDAFAARFEPLRPMIFRVACRLVGETDAEDVVMDTFLKAWQALPGFRGGAAITTWLYRIAWNCADDHLRRRRRELHRGLAPDATPPDLASFPAPDGHSPEDLAAQADDARQLHRALSQLPDAQRVALLLRYADDLSYRDIAAATGVRIGTVMSRLFQGRRRLRRLLDSENSAALKLASEAD